MNQPHAEPWIACTESNTNRDTVHDLRAPLVNALGYLDELRIIRDDLLGLLSHESTAAANFAIDTEQIVMQLDTEMGLCIDVIKESLEKLDVTLMGLRESLHTIDREQLDNR